MIEPLALGAGAFGVVWVAYQYGKMRSKASDGCNGHHWGEPYFPDDEGISSIEREHAFKDTGLYADYPRIREDPTAHYSTTIGKGRVHLQGKAIRKCQDCGKRKVVDKTVGSVALEDFE